MSGGQARIEARFAELRSAGRGGLVTFLTAGDPNYELSREILFGLPEAGADLIELGMAFTDPMADGPAIQRSSRRALDSGITLARTVELVAEFRQVDETTPIILMGYYNPIHHYGVAGFLADARAAGVDGLIVVDLPPEEDAELCLPTLEAGLGFIRLATPTTDDKRLPAVLANTSGFVYYVSYTGITGARAIDEAVVAEALARLARHTDLPLAVGFGIREPDQARAIARVADAVVVGSALVDVIAKAVDADGAAEGCVTARVHARVRALAEAVRGARNRVEAQDSSP